jgi:DNA-binding NtrC family response regulator
MWPQASSEFVHSAHPPSLRLGHLLGARLGSLADQAGLSSVSLWLHDAGTLALSRVDGSVRVEWLHAAVPAAGQQVLPVRYGEASLGELHLAWPRDAARAPAGDGLCEAAARQCALLVKRYELQRWAMQRLGRPVLLVGQCPALLALDGFVEKAARCALPVLLAGEFGTEKAALAVAIHGAGPRRDGPFVEVRCADPEGSPAQWFAAARGGTLFLDGIDDLALQWQRQLPQHLPSRLGQWPAGSQVQEPRIIAAATADLRERAAAGRFSQALLAELDFLRATLPPLRERGDDIEHLVAVALERQGHGVAHKRSDELMAVCRAYAWPENLFELERVIARLAVMTDGHPIRHADVARHAPWLVAQAPCVPVPTRVPAPEPPAPAGPEHWARCALHRNAAALAALHPGVRRALAYLVEHYAEPVALGQLAQHAHVSPSHLSYLFRSTLHTTFKPMLQRIRVEKAKEMLVAAGRRRITEVAWSAGFADLSHFEKSFRRIVGQSPSEFRRGAAGAQASSAASV